MTYQERVESYEAQGMTTSDAQGVVDAEELKAPTVTYTATYSPDDNKLRLSCSHRLDPETYGRLKAAGYKWAPKQGQFVAPMWTPSREDIALELAGEIGDEDTTLLDRAEVRADRFEGYSEKRGAEADRAKAGVDTLAGGIPFGQPILVGHHSEKRARKDAQRIENGMRQAVKLWETSQYWEQRAQGAIAHAKYKELPAVRARRIKGIEADKRKAEKETKEREKLIAMWTNPDKELTLERAKLIAGFGHLSYCFTLDKYPRELPASQYEGPMGVWSALDGGVITAEQARDLTLKAYTAGNKHRARWMAHYDNRLTYEKAMLNEQGASDLLAPKARPKQLPLVNYKQESFTLPMRWRKGELETLPQVELTSEEYMAINVDCRGTREVDNSHRIRIAIVSRNEDGSIRRFAGHQAKTCAVYLTDSKTHKKPEPMEKAVMAEPMPRERVYTPAPIDPRAAEFEALKDAASKGVQVATGSELFPTPSALASRVIDECNVQPGDCVLEPSAGTGSLMQALEGVECHGVAVELSQPLADALSSRFMGWNVLGGDFLDKSPDELGDFERIVMNPPFSGQQDIAHVTHALKFLKPGGRLVAIMSAGVSFCEDTKARTFRELVEVMGGTIEALPADSFKASGTGVNTVLVTIDA